MKTSVAILLLNLGVLVQAGQEETTPWEHARSASQQQQQQHGRELLFFRNRRSSYCAQESRDTFVTTTPNFFQRFSFRRNNVPEGDCADMCDELCDHQPCMDDYVVNGDTCVCMDTEVYPCGQNTRCSSETCVCLNGFLGDPNSLEIGCVDVDECATGDNICGTNQCRNIPGSYECICSPGYTWMGISGGGCMDINECANPDICGTPYADCINTPGSYTCTCKQGFRGTPPNCADIDECAENPNICGANQFCTNTIGGAQCSCNAGYVPNADNTACVDRNECADNPCNSPAEVCVNLEGSYRCDCASGYSGSPCTDINECTSSPGICGANRECTNTPGSYSCRCLRGYVGDNCQPTECTLNGVICGYGADCIVANGSYSCACPAGYQGDPADQCFDVDECQTAGRCGADFECVNTPGSFECKKPTWATCNSADECFDSNCANRSRSDTTKVCCSFFAPCNAGFCCNGAYKEGEPCPSTSRNDCEGSLLCARANRDTLDYACCQDVEFPLIGQEAICV